MATKKGPTIVRRHNRWRDIRANLFADNSPSRDEEVAALSDVDGFVARISAEYNRELSRYTPEDNREFFHSLWKQSKIYEQEVWEKWLVKNMEEHVGDDADEERRVDIAKTWLRSNFPSQLRVNHRNHMRADKIRKDLGLYQKIHMFHRHIPTKVEETTEDPDDLLFHDVTDPSPHSLRNGQSNLNLLLYAAIFSFLLVLSPHSI